MTLVLDAFPLFFTQPACLVIRYRTIVFDVGWRLSGLYISPMWLGAAIGGGFNSLNHLAQYALLFSTVPILVSLCRHGSLGRFGAHPDRAHSAESRSRGHGGTKTRASGRVATGSVMCS